MEDQKPSYDRGGFYFHGEVGPLLKSIWRALSLPSNGSIDAISWVPADSSSRDISTAKGAFVTQIQFIGAHLQEKT